MSLTQVGTSHIISGAAGASAAVPVPAGLSTNDLAVVIGKVDYPADANTIVAPTGWTAVPGAAFHMTSTGTAPDHWQIVAFYKYISGDSGSWAFSWTNSANYEFQCDVIRGAPTSSPIDIAVTRNTTYSGSQPAASQTWTGPTLGQANEYVVMCICNNNGYNYTGITGWTNRSAGTTSSELWDKLFTSSGPSGNVTAVASNICDQTATFIAIRAVALPTNTVQPTITGTPTQGQILTAHSLVTDWTGTPTLTWQWNRDGVPIPTATAATYLLDAADIGHVITITVTGTNSAGSATATSNPTATIAASGTAPSLVTLPVISGPPTEWATLSVTDGVWNGSGTITKTYQWRRTGVNIPGATAATYQLVLADVGQTIDCIVTATNGSGNAAATAAQVGPIAGSINTPTPGQVIHVDVTGDFASDTPMQYTYQWLQDGSPIGAPIGPTPTTTSSYTVTSSDVGHTIAVTVTATNAAGPPGTSQTTAATGAVIAAPTISTPPRITGQAVQGQTLTALPAVWNNAPTAIARQWNRDGVPIASAIDSTYLLVLADVGHVITVTETALNLVGLASSTSAGTASVTGSGATTFPIALSGNTISWSAFAGATSYTAVGFSDPRPHVGSPVVGYLNIGNVLSWTPPSAPGQTIYYGIAANTPAGGAWCDSEVSIVWPPAPAGTILFGVTVGDWGGNTSFGVSGGQTEAQDIVSAGLRYIKLGLDGFPDKNDLKNWYLSHPELSAIITFTGPSTTGGVVALVGSDLGQSWANAMLAMYQSYVNPAQCKAIEILNEPYGPWAWGSNANSQANAEAYGQLVRTTYTTFHNALGSACPPIIAAVFANGGGTGQPVGAVPSWWTWLHNRWPDIASFYDGVVLHPYGGTGNATLSAQGDRNGVLSARSATGKPVWITEVGWPDGAQSGMTTPTGDSLQWTDAQQAANIVNFVGWCKGQGAGVVAAVMVYSHLDDSSSPSWYGLCYYNNPAGASFRHKPAFSAYVGAI